MGSKRDGDGRMDERAYDDERVRERNHVWLVGSVGSRQNAATCNSRKTSFAGYAVLLRLEQMELLPPTRRLISLCLDT